MICILLNGHFSYSFTIIEISTERSSIDNTTHNLTICSNDKWFSFYEKVWMNIDATIYSFLPFILISVFNSSIVIILIRERNKSLNLQQSQCSYSSRNSSCAKRNKKSLATPMLKSFRNSEFSKSSSSEGRMAIVEYNHDNSIVTICFKRKSKN